MTGTSAKGWIGAAFAALIAFPAPATAAAFDLELEAKNFAKILTNICGTRTNECAGDVRF